MTAIAQCDKCLSTWKPRTKSPVKCPVCFHRLPSEESYDLPTARCKRCGESWITRSSDPDHIRQCPNCHAFKPTEGKE